MNSHDVPYQHGHKDFIKLTQVLGWTYIFSYFERLWHIWTSVIIWLSCMGETLTCIVWIANEIHFCSSLTHFLKSCAFYQTQKPATEELNDITAGYDSLYDGNPPAGCPSGCALMEYVKILSVLKGSVGRKLRIVKELRERGSSKHCYIHDECLTSKSDLNENNNRPYTCLYVRLYVYMHHHLCGISFMLHSATYQTLTLCGFRQSEW